MTNHEQGDSSEHIPEPIDNELEQDGEFLDVTGRLAELQAGLIDYLVDYRTAHPWETSNTFGALEYRDTKIGMDFSQVDWLERGDILVLDKTINLVLQSRNEQRYFTRLGSGYVLSGEVRTPWIVTVPASEALPEDMAPYTVFENGPMQWSVALELGHVIALKEGVDQPDILDLGQHFRVLLPLVYTDARALHYRP